MVDYVLLISPRLKDLALSRGHRVYCFERIRPCLSIPPSNSEAHRFASKYFLDANIYQANPDEVLEVFRHFAEKILPQEKNDIISVSINEWPYGPYYEYEKIDDKTTYYNLGEFHVYEVKVGNTFVYFEPE